MTFFMLDFNMHAARKTLKCLLLNCIKMIQAIVLFLKSVLSMP